MEEAIVKDEDVIPARKESSGRLFEWFVSICVILAAAGACWGIWWLGGGSWFEQELLNVIGYVGVLISLSGVLIAFLIFRQQKREQVQAQRFQTSAQASQSKVLEDLGRVLDRVEQKVDQTLESASSTVSDSEAEEGSGAADLWANVLPEGDGDVARYVVSRNGKRRRLFLPGAIPLAVIGALVKVWDEAELTGRWALSTLRGAFRAEGKGNHPWYLVFVAPSEESNPQIWKVTRGPGGTDHAVEVTDGREFS